MAAGPRPRAGSGAGRPDRRDQAGPRWSLSGPGRAVAPQAPLRLPCRAGRLRRLRHLALLPLLVGGAGFWLGLAGAAPMLVWWWLRRPRPATGGAEWVVLPGAARRYRFGRFRTLLELDAGADSGAGSQRRRLEIFHDELAPADLALLRREVKAAGVAQPPD